ncbi:MAG: hypothetical protein Q8L68_07110 [Methylococcales bacterium]|nr:hypothetical protein [Methylococcales bacterium]
MKITSGVYQVGNTVVDSLLAVMKKIEGDSDKYAAKFSALPDSVGSYRYVVFQLYAYGKTATDNTLILIKQK